jgi:hypothetical protein
MKYTLFTKSTAILLRHKIRKDANRAPLPLQTYLYLVLFRLFHDTIIGYRFNGFGNESMYGPFMIAVRSCRISCCWPPNMDSELLPRPKPSYIRKSSENSWTYPIQNLSPREPQSAIRIGIIPLCQLDLRENPWTS